MLEKSRKLIIKVKNLIANKIFFQDGWNHRKLKTVQNLTKEKTGYDQNETIGNKIFYSLLSNSQSSVVTTR